MLHGDGGDNWKQGFVGVGGGSWAVEMNGSDECRGVNSKGLKFKLSQCIGLDDDD